MKVTIGLAVLLSLFDQQALGIKQTDILKDDFITTAQLEQTKSSKKHKKTYSEAESNKDVLNSKQQSHDGHIAGLHLDDFQPSDIKKSKDDSIIKQTKEMTKKIGKKAKEAKKVDYKKVVPIDEQAEEGDIGKENESVDAHIAGFHKHIAKADPTENLEKEIMGAVKMTDYDELTKDYKNVHKNINEDVVKDKYQDQVPVEEQEQKQQEIKTGDKADHYEDHGEEKQGNEATESLEPKEEKDLLPHGAHADHYEDHGTEKQKPMKKSKHSKKKKSDKKKKLPPKETKPDDEVEESDKAPTLPKVEEQQKPLEEQLDIKKTKDNEEFNSQKKKMKIESLPKPEPQEEDPNKPAEEKQPLEAKVINSGHMPNKDKPTTGVEEQQIPVKTHQKSSKSHKSKKHHHVHHAQNKYKKSEAKNEKEEKEEKVENSTAKEAVKTPEAPASTTIVAAPQNTTMQSNQQQPIQIVIQQQGMNTNTSMSSKNSSQVQQPTVQTLNGGQQIIVSIPVQQQAPKAEKPQLTPLSELVQKQKTKQVTVAVAVKTNELQSEQLVEDDPYLHAESLSSSDQDAYPGLAQIYQKQEKVDKYMSKV